MLKKLGLSLSLVLCFLTAGSVLSAEMINLNTATQEQLETLPSVGPATAEAIIEYREQVGDFKSVDEVTNVKGIGESKLSKMFDLITVETPEKIKVDQKN